MVGLLGLPGIWVLGVWLPIWERGWGCIGSIFVNFRVGILELVIGSRNRDDVLYSLILECNWYGCVECSQLSILVKHGAHVLIMVGEIGTC